MSSEDDTFQNLDRFFNETQNAPGNDDSSSDGEWAGYESNEPDYGSDNLSEGELENLPEIDFESERQKSRTKLMNTWDKIIERFGAEETQDDGDVVDIMSGKIVENNGHLQSIRPDTNSFWGSLAPSAGKRLRRSSSGSGSFSVMPVKKSVKRYRKFVQLVLGDDYEEPTTSDVKEAKPINREYPVMSMPSCRVSDVACSRPFCSRCA